MRYTHEKRICGITVRFFEFAIGEAMPIPEEYEPTTAQGFFNEGAGAIYYRYSENSDVVDDTQEHESFHALLTYSGAAAWLANLAKGGRRKEPFEELEEEFVRILTPHLRAK